MTPEARTRLAPDRRTNVREIVYSDGDLIEMGAVRVTTPLRTALDLVRAPAFDREAAAVVARLAAIGGFGLDDCRAELATRTGIPSRTRVEDRLMRALSA